MNNIIHVTSLTSRFNRLDVKLSRGLLQKVVGLEEDPGSSLPLQSMTSSYQGGGSTPRGDSPTGFSASSSLENSSSIGGFESGDSVGFFSSAGSDKKTSDSDLSTMLESNKDSLKLEAMKRIIGLMARGGGGASAKDLFPSVVKNVVSKNVEVKKLVYVYLTRYAEEMPDLALLSISAFQRSLKDPNQLIRASALRVLSSIRVSVVVPIVICALKEASVDMSPFVRKTAAHAIPKVVSLDPETKNELIDVIEKLLADRTTLVVGSAVMAFSEVCPNRVDLLHKHFRKLCNLLVDVEEWGQVVIVNTLTHYARAQFQDPNKSADMETAKIVSGFYESSSASSSSDDDDGNPSPPAKMDPDHRLLLRSAKPLLQSRNAAVVMAAAQLYFHCAPRPEIQIVSKALIRLLRSHKEVQSIVLNSIATMTSERVGTMNSMFESHLRNFFVRGSDPTHIKILKLEIITNLATEGNIGIILREFQTYITSQDKVCVGATIQAIGRCASTISDVTDTCLSGLVFLLSNRDEDVVAESVVVIKKLLQTQSGDHKEIIIQMAKLLDTISVPSARSAILWVIGEYSSRIPLVAPDVLRKVAKSFTAEDDSVKMQVLNLALKLVLSNPKQTRLIAQYVFNLSKYDANYDIRDRSRFLRVFVFPPGSSEPSKMIKHSKKIFLASKPAPLLESKFKGRSNFQLGSLSHFLNNRVQGYQDLPDFPEVAPDPSVRNVEPPKVANNPWDKYLNNKFDDERAKKKKNGGKKEKHFYSDSGSSSNSSSSSSGSSSDSSSDEEEKDVRPPRRAHPPLKNGVKANSLTTSRQLNGNASSSSSEDSSEDSSSSSSDSSNESDDDVPPKSNLDLLLDLSSNGPEIGLCLTPSSASEKNSELMKDSTPRWVDENPKELLSRVASGGLQVSYRFTRSRHSASDTMLNVELILLNSNDSGVMSDIKIGKKDLSPGVSLHEFPGIHSIPCGQSVKVNLGIDYNDTMTAAVFELLVDGVLYKLSISPPVGELLRPVDLDESTFKANLSKLGGMNEVSSKVEGDDLASPSWVYSICNVAPVQREEEKEKGSYIFAGRTMKSQSLVLISIVHEDTKAIRITVNCEKIVMGNLLLESLVQAMSKSE